MAVPWTVTVEPSDELLTEEMRIKHSVQSRVPEKVAVQGSPVTHSATTSIDWPHSQAVPGNVCVHCPFTAGTDIEVDAQLMVTKTAEQPDTVPATVTLPSASPNTVSIVIEHGIDPILSYYTLDQII
jgi:hypothetical protein